MFDFDEPRFNTRELLSLIVGLEENALKQWRARGILTGLSAHAFERPARYTGRDVLQVALARELTRQGLLVRGTQAIWRVINARIRDWETGVALPQRDRRVIFLHVDAGGMLKMLEASETEIDFKAINDRGAGSDVQVMIRLDHFLARNIEAMEQVIEAGEAGPQSRNGPASG